MPKIPPPETVALIRRRYAEGVPVRAICAESGVTNADVICRCVDGEFPDGSGVKPAPLPRRRPGLRVRGRNGSRAALVARIWHTAEMQVEEIETCIKAAGLKPAEREGNARTLATLVKTLHELSAIDDPRRRGKPSPDDDHDESPPRDIDELRRSLAQKLHALVAAGDRRDPGEAE